ncbi:MAG TPA: amidohydrolase family protein [Steroidobacter sp.]|jgi:predicted TIM-barrel fold metal-dependent hydrolase
MLPPFVDAHIHLWDLTYLRYPWLEATEVAHLRQNYLPQDLRADAEGLPLKATVHVQAELDHELDPAIETAWLDEMRKAHGVPTVCIAYADLRARDLAATLDRHAAYPFFRGIRQEAWFDPNSTRADLPRENLLDDPAWRAGLDVLCERQLTFDLFIWARQIDQAREIFRDRSDLSVVLEHCGLPPVADPEELTRWRTALRAFAREVPNSTLKISAMAFIAKNWQLADIRPVVCECIDAFGPQRCMFASNFPVEKAAGSYRRLWEAYDAITSPLTSGERTAIFHDTAARVYRIDP